MWDWSPIYGGPWTFSNYGWLIGRVTHYFEFSAGMTYAYSGDLRGLLPSGAIGYRYVSSEGKLVLRANVAFPEALNLGLGISFGLKLHIFKIELHSLCYNWICSFN